MSQRYYVRILLDEESGYWVTHLYLWGGNGEVLVTGYGNTQDESEQDAVKRLKMKMKQEKNTITKIIEI